MNDRAGGASKIKALLVIGMTFSTWASHDLPETN